MQDTTLSCSYRDQRASAAVQIYRCRLVIMPGTEGHTMHGKQKQPLIKMPHRSDQKKIMLGFQVTNRILLSLRPACCVANRFVAAQPAVQFLLENPDAQTFTFNTIAQHAQMPMWESINGSFLKVRTQQTGGNAHRTIHSTTAETDSMSCRPAAPSSLRQPSSSSSQRVCMALLLLHRALCRALFHKGLHQARQAVRLWFVECTSPSFNHRHSSVRLPFGRHFHTGCQCRDWSSWCVCSADALSFCTIQ